MWGRDPRRARRVRALAALAVLGAMLGAAGSSPARAQEEPPATLGDELFGIYELEARGQGVQGLYEVVDFLPGGAAVLDLSIPETLARFASGPTGYGLASLAYPGGVFVNLPSLAEQGGAPPESVPEYPIKAEAFYPSGPLTADESQEGGYVQRATTGDLGVDVRAVFPAIESSPVVDVGSIRSASRTSIEGDLAVSRTRVALGDVVLLGGLLSMDSVVTDLVAVHDGNAGTTSGRTTASGIRFLGLAASLTEDGLVLDRAAPPSDAPGGTGPLGSLLDPLVDPLTDLSAPVQDLLEGVLEQAVPTLDDVLAQAGLEVTLLDPHDVVVDGGAATRTSSGLTIRLSYKGREQEELYQLLSSIPEDLKPSLGAIPNPLTFLVENHVMGVSLAPATVSVLATPPFPDFEFPLDDFGAGGFDDGAGAVPDLGDGGFSTPLPDVPTRSGGGQGAPSLRGDATSNLLSGAVPALLVVLTLLAAPFFGVGTSRLADNVLAAATTSCPTGHDRPPSERLP